MFMEEMRKLKTVIVKHENRIRTLEAQMKELLAEKEANNASGDVPLDPDEV